MVTEYKQLEKLVEEIFFKDIPIQVITGKGGCKDFIKEYCKQLNIEYNWRNIRLIYTQLVREGRIQRFKSNW